LGFAGMLGLRGGASLKAAATMGGGPEEVVVVVFLLGDVVGLQESLGQVGDGAGGSGFNIAADHCGDEAAPERS